MHIGWAALALLVLLLPSAAMGTQEEVVMAGSQEVLAIDSWETRGLLALARSENDLVLVHVESGKSELVKEDAWPAGVWAPNLLAIEPPVTTWMSEVNSQSDIWASAGTSAHQVHVLQTNPDPIWYVHNSTSPTRLVDTGRGPSFAWLDFSNDPHVARQVWVATFQHGQWSKEVVHDVPKPASTRDYIATTSATGELYVAYHLQTEFPDGALEPVLLAPSVSGWSEQPLPDEVQEILAAPPHPRNGADLSLLVWTLDGSVSMLDWIGEEWVFNAPLFEFPEGSTHHSAKASGPALINHEGDLTVRFLVQHSDGPGFGENHFWRTENGAWVPIDESEPRAPSTWGSHDDLFFINREFDGNAFQYSIDRLRFTPGPTASFTLSEQLTTRTAMVPDDQTVALDDAALAAWQWDFGDGTTVQGPTPQHVYDDPGEYWVQLTVTDDSGGQDSTNRFVEVAQVGPSACIDGGTSETTGAAVSITDCSTHPESNLGATIESHAWDFGDGTTSTTQNPSHTYTSPGTYTITLTVTDEQGTTDTATKTITVTDPPANQKPSVTVSFTPEAPVAGQDVTFTATATDSDGSIASKAWTVNGVNAGTGSTLTQTFTETGIVSVTFTATDDDGATTTVTKSVNVQAPAPPEISLSQTQITDKSGQEFAVDITVTNPNPVPVTVDLASDAPAAWSPAFDEPSIQLAAGESTTITYTITPPYTVGGLTLITIEASTGDATDSAILRAQFTVGDAPETGDPVDDPVNDPTDDDEPVTNTQPETQDSKSGMPTWAWFVGSGAVVLAGVGVTLVLVLRKP